MSKRVIAGIDPGLLSGGLVAVDGNDADAVLEAISLVTKDKAVKEAKRRARANLDRLDGWGDLDFTAAVLRIDLWMELFVAGWELINTKHGRIEAVGIESFVDQKQHAKQMKSNRWMTPLLTGHLSNWLEQRGYAVEAGNVVYQDAGVVLKNYEVELSELKTRRAGVGDLIVSGDGAVTNGHQRSALAHAWALSLRLRELRR